MKKLPFVQRLRESPSGVVVPVQPEVAGARRPFRLWMTGSLAVVMAAMIPMRYVSDAERSNVMRLLRHSRYDVNETVQRIEAAARDHGLFVLAKMPGAASQTSEVLVLASSVGGTLVVMDEADSKPAMPMSMMVSAVRGGGAEVLIASSSDAGASRAWPELPSDVVRDLEALPGLVDTALL
jgi:uncharacterized protein (DUF302 family)